MRCAYPLYILVNSAWVEHWKACAAAFLDAVARGLPAPIPLDEVLEVSRVSIEVAKNLS